MSQRTFGIHAYASNFFGSLCATKRHFSILGVSTEKTCVLSWPDKTGPEDSLAEQDAVRENIHSPKMRFSFWEYIHNSFV